MMNTENSLNIWHLLTRLDDVQIVLPAAVLVLNWLLITAAAPITTASKVVFIGWAVVDFTGVSGHAMFAAGVYSMHMLAMVSERSPSGRRFSFLH